jgi:hypothetical protein
MGSLQNHLSSFFIKLDCPFRRSLPPVALTVDSSQSPAADELRCLHLGCMKITLQLLANSWKTMYSAYLSRLAGSLQPKLMWLVLVLLFISVGVTMVTMIESGLADGAWPSPSQWAYAYGKSLFVVTMIGSLILTTLYLLFALIPGPRIWRWGKGQQKASFAAMMLAGMIVGWPLGLAFWGGINFVSRISFDSSDWRAGSLLVFLLISVVFNLIFRAKASQVEVERRTIEAQLQLLQAQMEPHFLFNTLANVESLIDHAPTNAKGLLSAFTSYLRASLSGLHRTDRPLTEELQLAEAYLHVQKTRMEERLRYSIDVDFAARSAAVPSLILQPLIENAVRHGLEPQIEGGTVWLVARVQGDELVIDVRANGRGQGRSTRKDQCVAFAKVRQRLALRFGGSARLEVSEYEAGTQARMVMPLESMY